MTIRQYNVATIRNVTLDGAPITEGKALLIRPVYKDGDYSPGTKQYWCVQFYSPGARIAGGPLCHRWVKARDCYDITDPRHPNHGLTT